MKESKKTNDLENLIQTKNFLELTRSERKFVLNQISEEEYNTYRNIILKSKSVLKLESSSVLPNPSIHLKIIEEFKERTNKKKGIILQLVTHKVQSYKVVAVAIFVLVILFILNQRTNQSNETQIVYIYETDTIYKEKIVKMADTNLQKDHKYINLTKSKRKASKNSSNPNPSYSTHSDKNTRQQLQFEKFPFPKVAGTSLDIDIADFIQSRKKGRSYRDDSSLTKFLVSSTSGI